jgi:hypothetical protein
MQEFAASSHDRPPTLVTEAGSTTARLGHPDLFQGEEHMSSNGKAVRRGLGLAGLAAVLTFSAAGIAQAAPVATTVATPGDVVISADCTYVAIRNTVVRTGAGVEYPIARRKTKGQHMTGPAPCVASNGWFKVYLSTGTYGYTPAADSRVTG